MKRNILIFIVSVLSVIQLKAQTNFTLSGNLPSEVKGNIQLIIDRTFFNANPEVITSPITNGHFEVKANLNRNYVIVLSSGSFRFPIYAEPGYELTLNIADGETNLTNVLSGKGSDENNFLQTFFSNFGGDFNDSLNEAQMLINSIDAFENILFLKKKTQLEFIKSSDKKSVFSADFNSFLENEINYHYWRDLYAFPIVNANKDSKILTVVPLPQVMLDNFTRVKINNEAALISNSYKDFIKYFIIYSASRSNGFNKFTDPTISADRKSAVAKEKLEGNVFVYWLSRYTTEECQNLGGLMVKKLLGTLKDADINKTSYPIVEAVCNSKAKSPEIASLNQQQTKTPAKSNGAEAGLIDLKGKPVTLDNFKGKVVYIDFWASWCGPCRKMMPFSKMLHEQLTDKQKKQIAFLYISIDADSAAWRKAMIDMSMEGTQFISPGNWSSKACKYFQINSIPRYMIMNKKGEIVDINAKRPSDPAVLQDLLKLAEEK